MARTVEEIMTRDPRTVSATDTVFDASRRMRDDDIGDVIVMDGDRVAGIVTVTENGRPVGIVSLGDLALERGPESTLADISAAPPDN
jgi:CBS domain-containing protein